jgi:hypothetical protein
MLDMLARRYGRLPSELAVLHPEEFELVLYAALAAFEKT